MQWGRTSEMEGILPLASSSLSMDFHAVIQHGAGRIAPDLLNLLLISHKGTTKLHSHHQAQFSSGSSAEWGCRRPCPSSRASGKLRISLFSPPQQESLHFWAGCLKQCDANKAPCPARLLVPSAAPLCKHRDNDVRLLWDNREHVS